METDKRQKSRLKVDFEGHYYRLKILLIPPKAGTCSVLLIII